MGKTNLTQRLETILKWKYGFKIGKFLVYEVQFGFHQREAEFCDAVLYETNGKLTCFELKQTVSDFHSKSKVTFVGNKNYYIMPVELWEKVKDEVPKEIGVQVLCSVKWEWDEGKCDHKRVLIAGDSELICVKNCVEQEKPKYDENVILWSMLRSMCNRSNRKVEENSVSVSKAVSEHLQLVSCEGKLLKLNDEPKHENCAVELYVQKDLCPEDFKELFKILKGRKV